MLPHFNCLQLLGVRNSFQRVTVCEEPVDKSRIAMMDRATREKNLAQLQKRVQECEARHGHPKPSALKAERAERLAQGMPLSNGASAATFAKIAKDREIRCQSRIRSELGPSGKPTHEERLGTDRCVPFFAGPFLYPKSECGLLFNRSLEEAHRAEGACTPFDSGALIKVHAVSDPHEFMVEHEVPVPEHRELLSEVLARLFNDPWDYLDGKDPRSSSHFGLTKGDARRYTHEVRIPDAVGILDHVMAVFVTSSRVADPSIMAYLVECEKRNIDYVPVPAGHSGNFQKLSRSSTNYIRVLLSEEASV